MSPLFTSLRITVCTILSLLKFLYKYIVKHVTKRTMANIMTKSSYGNIQNFTVSHFKLWLFLLYDAHLLASQVASSNTMLKSTVSSIRESLISQT